MASVSSENRLTMMFAAVNGITLGYRVAGPATGQPLVLVNSLGTDARIWDDVIEHLSPRYRILSYDKRGHGLSDAPAGPCALADHLDDLADLTSYVGMERFSLCGVSIGGMIGQLAGAHLADRLDALVLCSTAAKIGDATMWNARIAAVERDGIASISDAVLDRWFSAEFRSRQPARHAGYRNMLERTTVAGYVASCSAIRDADLQGAATTIRTATLMIAGANDRSTPPELVKQTAALIRGASFATIPDCGHIPSIEQPEALARLIDDHIQGAVHD